MATVCTSVEVAPALLEGTPAGFAARVHAEIGEWVARRPDASEHVVAVRADAMTCDATVQRGWFFGFSVYVARTAGTSRLDVVVKPSSPLFRRLFLHLDAALVVAGFVFLLWDLPRKSEAMGVLALTSCFAVLAPLVLLELAIARVANPVSNSDLMEISERVTRSLESGPSGAH